VLTVTFMGLVLGLAGFSLGHLKGALAMVIFLGGLTLYFSVRWQKGPEFKDWKKWRLKDSGN